MRKTLVIYLLGLLPVFASAQNSIEFSAVVGATAVDLDALVEETEIAGSFVSNSDVANYGISIQYAFPAEGSVGFCLELMYHKLFWYTVTIPYVPSDIYRTYHAQSTRLTPIIRFGANSAFSFDIGPEFNFMSKMRPGLMASLNGNIRLSDGVKMPIKLRTDFISSTVAYTPISLNVGIRVML